MGQQVHFCIEWEIGANGLPKQYWSALPTLCHAGKNPIHVPPSRNELMQLLPECIAESSQAPINMQCSRTFCLPLS